MRSKSTVQLQTMANAQTSFWMIVGTPLLLITVFCFSYIQYSSQASNNTAHGTSRPADAAKSLPAALPVTLDQQPSLPLIVTAPVTASSKPAQPAATQSPQAADSSSKALQNSPSPDSSGKHSSNPQSGSGDRHDIELEIPSLLN